MKLIIKFKKLYYLKIEAGISLFAGLKVLNILLQFVYVLKVEKNVILKLKDKIVYRLIQLSIKESTRDCDGLFMIYT